MTRRSKKKKHAAPRAEPRPPRRPQVQVIPDPESNAIGVDFGEPTNVLVLTPAQASQFAYALVGACLKVHQARGEIRQEQGGILVANHAPPIAAP